MNREDLLALRPDDVIWKLTAQEVVHIATTLDAFWSYNYEAGKHDKPGLHALLKSLRHSDGFFVSKIMLAHENIRKIMAVQMKMRLDKCIDPPDWLGGIPDGATELGEDLAELYGCNVAKMEKVDGKIHLISEIGDNETLLLAEDFCTHGTGFTEAIIDVHSKNTRVWFIFYEPVIINRGGLEYIEVEGVGVFKILPIAEYRINDWSEDQCLLCHEFGSKPIKPKKTDENWEMITTAQL
ncbi:MAG: hypothetical protein U9O20_02760 [Patescibacteria group bacterium]|nr:hypothetical protein [Patescibacteria group bacterium]